MITLFKPFFFSLVLAASSPSLADQRLSNEDQALMDRAVTAIIGQRLITEVARVDGLAVSRKPYLFPISMGDHYLETYPLPSFLVLEGDIMKNELAVNAKYPNGALVGAKVQRIFSIEGQPAMILRANGTQSSDTGTARMLVRLSKKWLSSAAKLRAGNSIALVCKDFAFDKPLPDVRVSASCDPAGAHVLNVADITKAKPFRESATCASGVLSGDFERPSLPKAELESIGKIMEMEVYAPDLQVGLLGAMLYEKGDPANARAAIQTLTTLDDPDFLFMGLVDGHELYEPWAYLSGGAFAKEDLFEVMASLCAGAS